MTAYSPLRYQVNNKIEVSDLEKKIFDRLLGTLSKFGLQTQLRVAGGWVRDKLLGKECNDIDIALDNMMGSQFVDKVREYLCNRRRCARSLCNRKSEEYAENSNSHIPTKQSFGTAEEDAYRRDLTINSLFYNINTDTIEDFTKRGISYLKSGNIVTHLPPKETLLDDPLRVLRAIRFGARFEFILDEDLKGAVACDEICDQTLFRTVFSLPPELEPPIADGCERLCITYLHTAWKLIQLLRESTFTDEQKMIALYTALFLPLRNTTYGDKKAKQIPIMNWIIRFLLRELKEDLFKSVENTIVVKLGLERVWEVRQLVNGKQVMKELEVKGGPLVKEWLEKAMAWQLAHPSGTAQECIDWLKQSNSKMASNSTL
ncbi:putative CCA tRNA nucleotidyltransferase 2 [Senna tora]|uniref:Putative CCA tRNA nucleotidyltransferase 2 n=1 Tax=Senna tora TaxID=362788 RepID=A0A835CGZ7_9FABA|nr:putative CCA tRNA nucleotidyltransferase 2 [Senna tora]